MQVEIKSNKKIKVGDWGEFLGLGTPAPEINYQPDQQTWDVQILISALQKQTQADLCELKTNQNYIIKPYLKKASASVHT